MKKLLIVILIMIIILFCTSFIYEKNNVEKTEYGNILDETEQKNNEEKENYEMIIQSLKNKYNNEDVIGVLNIPEADYNVPLLQGGDNDYYLKHTPDKNYNQVGSIFLDYRVNIDTSKKQLIYGHNSSTIDMPFKVLENYYDREYYENHKYIEIISSTQKKKYEIFSVYVEPEDFTYMKIEFGSDEDYLNHIKDLQAKSMYEIDVDLNEDDEVLIMQTCSTHKDYAKYSKKYLLIISRRVL